MSKQIVPTIFATSKEQFRNKVESLSSFATLVHIDVCDGEFVPTKTIDLSKEVEYFLLSKLECEFHLMVENPLKYLGLIKEFKGKLVYVQVEILESVEQLKNIIDNYKQINCGVGLVFNPITYVEDYLKYLSYVNYVMIMSVVPGAEGQAFREEVLEKVHHIKSLKSSMIIQIDGGINDKTGKIALKAGVDRLAVGSYITSSKNSREHFKKLESFILK